MTTSTATPSPIRRLVRSQSPLTVTIELLFALLILAAFWSSRTTGFTTKDQHSLSPLPPAVEQPAHLPPGGLPFAPLISFDPAGQECRQLILNGSFEETDIWQLPLTPRPAVYTDEQASLGSRSLRLGIGPLDQPVYGDSQARLGIDLPADAREVVLMADLWPTANGNGRDRQYLHLQIGPERHTLLDEQRDASSWQTVVFDLSPLAGSRGELIFGVFNSGGPGRAGMGVDNVRLYACGFPSLAADDTSQKVNPAPETLQPQSSDPLSLLLPLIFQTQGSGKNGATPTATPAACAELVANGSFESSGDWTIPNTPRPGRFATELIWSGSRSLGLGIPPGQANLHSDSTAYQWISLPANAAQITLRAGIWRASSSPGGGDYHYLWISADGKTTRIVQGLDDTRRWQEITYDLTPLAGKRLLLLLGTFNDGQGGVASLFADGVSVQVCTTRVTPAPPSTPTLTPQPAATANHAPPATMRSPDFGANAFLWRRPEIAERDLQLMKEAGFRWVRQSFAWEDIQPQPDGYEWEQADRVVAQANASSLSLLARLGMDPDATDFWAGQPPASNAKFVEFVARLAQRYNCTPEAVGCVAAWQVWNEPNLAREWGGNRPSPAQYVELLAQVHRAIKTANPNALVISAGMAPTDTDNALAMPDSRFYEEMYRAMGGSSAGYFDLLGVHAAGFAAPPESDPAQVAATPAYGGQRFFAFRHVEDIRKIMQANGDGGKRVAILEFGWTSDPVNPAYLWHGAGAGVDEFVKADYLRRAYLYAEEHWQPWIGLMSALTMPNLEWLNDGDPFDEEQYWWAILEPSRIDELRLRPAFVELCVYFRELVDRECPYAPR